MSTTEGNRILAAATKLLSGGVDALEMTELANAAGISRAALYRQVGSKEELLARLKRAGSVTPATLHAASTRQGVLAGTRKAIEEHGLLSVTVEQIAAASAVSPMTVYRLFGGRDEVIRAAFDELPTRLELTRLLERSDAPLRETLSRAVQAMLRLAHEHPDMLRLIAFGVGAEGRYLRRIRPHRGQAVRQLVLYFDGQARKGRVRDDVPAAKLASMLLGLVLSLGLSRVLAYDGGTELSLAAEAEALVDCFLRGVQQPAPATRRSWS